LIEKEVKSSIDKTLDRLGPAIKYLVYWKMNEIASSETPGKPESINPTANPEAFVNALIKVFGRASKNVEARIVVEIKTVMEQKKFFKIDSLVDLLRSIREDEEAKSIPTVAKAMNRLFPY
jgi:hypothetical protein